LVLKGLPPVPPAFNTTRFYQRGMDKKETAEEKAKTSIKIDPTLWKEAKIEAIMRDVELSTLVETALRKELKMKP